MNGIRGILFDLDGVLYVGHASIKGAAEAVARIRRSGFFCRFITNTTTKSIHSLHQKLAGLGFAVDANEILSAPQAAAEWLRSKVNASCHLVLNDEVKGAFAGVRHESTKPDYVIIGDIGDSWSYALLNQIFNMLMGGSELIALHEGKFWQTEDGLHLDIGAFVKGLEYASGKKAIVIGKPAPAFFETVLLNMKLPARACAIVGDDIDSDIGGGQQAGLKGILVKTGKYRPTYAERSPIKPDALLESINDLPAWLESHARNVPTKTQRGVIKYLQGMDCAPRSPFDGNRDKQA